MLEGRFMCEMSNYCEFMEVGKIYEFKKGVCVREDGSYSGYYSSLGEFHHKNPTVQIATISPKALLETGMVVEYNNGERALVLVGELPTEIYGIQKFVFLNRDSNGFMNESSYDDNLISKFGYYNVNRIYKPYVCSLNISNHCNESNLIWERPVPKPETKIIKMTLTEVATKLGLDENTKLEIEM